MQLKQSYRSRSNQAGFSLLEVLLVISILAVVLVVGLRMVKQHAKTDIIEKQALELQAVMQAAAYYESTKDHWPENHLYSGCEQSLPADEFTQQYLPNGERQASENHLFSAGYCWGRPVGLGTMDVKTPLFNIYLHIQGRQACRMAHQVSSLVPDSLAVPTRDASSIGTCNGQTNYWVRAQVVASQASAHGGGEIFMGSGECVPNGQSPECGSDEDFAASSTTCCRVANASPTQYRIHFPSCPSGTKPHVVYLPAFITYLHSSRHHSAQTIYDRDYIYDDTGSRNPDTARKRNPIPSCHTVSGSHQTTICSLTLGIGMNTSKHGVVDIRESVGYKLGSVGAVYVVSCLKK